MAGLNFANETEARHFSQTIQEKLNNRMKKLQGWYFLKTKFVLTIDFFFKKKKEQPT